MELEKFLEAANLLAYYKNLLRGKQKEYLLDHLERDLSLSEIAKNHGISRQAVSENIRRGISLLYAWEEKLGFYGKEREIYEDLKDLRKGYSAEKLDKIIGKLF
ncbi:MAG: hypothetical protein LBQ96_06730 [Fusobacteriaceae bacterium]|jgi:predicted DNA-binding protein YlxM (UPF0122 family)|nr:hypothetical protein [Fusobacteriaceae bacterium]